MSKLGWGQLLAYLAACIGLQWLFYGFGFTADTAGGLQGTPALIYLVLSIVWVAGNLAVFVAAGAFRRRGLLIGSFVLPGLLLVLQAVPALITQLAGSGSVGYVLPAVVRQALSYVVSPQLTTAPYGGLRPWLGTPCWLWLVVLIPFARLAAYRLGQTLRPHNRRRRRR